MIVPTCRFAYFRWQATQLYNQARTEFSARERTRLRIMSPFVLQQLSERHVRCSQTFVSRARRFAARQEVAHLGIALSLLHQFAWVPGGDYSFALGVEKNRGIGNRKDREKLMSYHHNGRTKTISQPQNKIVKSPRVNWIQTGPKARRKITETDPAPLRVRVRLVCAYRR